MFTHDLWQQHKYRIVGAGVGAFLHFVLFVFAALASHGYFLMYYVDYPFAILADWVSLGEISMVMLFALGGTLMYAVFGWVMGLSLEKIIDFYSKP